MIDVRLALDRDGFALRVEARLGAGTTGVLGANGAGKSTLLHAIAGLVAARGFVRVGDRVLQDTDAGVFLPPERRRVGMVFQDGRLFPHLSVARNLRYGGGTRFDEVVRLLALGALLHRRPATLSGGERQRVALGRALLCDPQLLLLDEPLSALDAHHKREVLPYLRRVTEAAGVPVLYVSHHLSDLLQVTDRLLVLDAGRAVGHGAVSDLLAEVPVLEVAHRIGLENVVPVWEAVADEVAGVIRARAGEVTLALPLDAPDHVHVTGVGRVALRPEDVIVVRGPVGVTSARNVLPGTVVRLVEAAGQVAVHVDVGWPLVVALTRSAVSELGLVPGVEVRCLVKTTSLRWVG